MVRAEKYIFFEASSQISDMDEKYEVLLTGDSSGQVKIYLGRDPSFFLLHNTISKEGLDVCL